MDEIIEDPEFACDCSECDHDTEDECYEEYCQCCPECVE